MTEVTVGIIGAVKTENGRGLREDWSQLVGRTVEVWQWDKQVATGKVDQASGDDAILWLAADGNETRRLYDKPSGFRVWA